MILFRIMLADIFRAVGFGYSVRGGTMALTREIKSQQLFQIWSTDPDLVVIVDVREECGDLRIPGSVSSCWDKLADQVGNDGGSRLFVVVGMTATNFDHWIQKHEYSNVMRLVDIENWDRYTKIDTKETFMKKDLIFNQLFEAETSTYTYLIADPETKEAVIIDPVLETVDRDLKLIGDLGLKLLYVLDTHVHADHVTGAGEIRKRTGAKTAVSGESGVECVDIPLEDGQQLRFGSHTVTTLATPGHTDSCVSFLVDGRVFTGDALLIRGTGRTDFQQGSSSRLYDSVHEKLFTLPDETVVYPGHDYRGFTSSTIGLEKKLNPRLGGGKTKGEFIQTMNELKLANPKKIHEAVPANLACGKKKSHQVFQPQIVNGIPEVTPEDLRNHLGEVRIIDVRRPDEYVGEYGHIAGAELVTLGPELEKLLIDGNRAEEIVFVCRSGGRSGSATAYSRELGYKFTINMSGGMIRWTELKYPSER